MLQEIFTKLCASYPGNMGLVDKLYDEIVMHYTTEGRYYHNLSHLENLIRELEPHRTIITSWDTMLFSVFYHDIIYNVPGGGNEEKSAALAEKRLAELGVAQSAIDKCKEQILATKAHSLSTDKDTNLFTDADLSILGKSPDVYDAYAAAIRKEYSVIPDWQYYNGRKGVLGYFLAMEQIYKTPEFAGKYERKARENMARELQALRAG